MKNRQVFLYKTALQVLCVLLIALPANAQYKSLLWKISGNGLKQPSYLFGTMHTADTRIVSFAKGRVNPYFNSLPAYAMELDLGSDDLDMSMVSKLMMGKDYSLSKMIPEKEYNMLDSMVNKQIGFSMSLFDNVAPVFILTIFESMSMGQADASLSRDGDVLDVYLYKQAKEANKKIIGIEKVDEQLSALESLSFQEQANLLVQEIDSSAQSSTEGSDMVHYYLNQDLDSLAASDDEIQMPEKFYKALVLDRNVRMANRIAAFIKQQGTFIAIGALHLPGDKGVIALLRKQGFKVEAVKK